MLVFPAPNMGDAGKRVGVHLEFRGRRRRAGREFHVIPDPRAALRHHKIVDGHLLRFAVSHKFEAIREEVLEHRAKLRFGRAFGDFGVHVEAGAVEPGRS